MGSIIVVHYENFDITYLNCAKLSSFTHENFKYQICELRSIIIVHYANFDITYLNCAQLSTFTTKTSISHIWTALNYHRSPRKLQYQICELRSIIIVHYANFDIIYLNCAQLSLFTTKTSISHIWTALNYHHSQRKLQYHISELR